MSEPTSTDETTPAPEPSALVIAVEGEFKGRRGIIKAASTPGLYLIHIFARPPGKGEGDGLSREERRRQFGSFEEWDAAEHWRAKQLAFPALDAEHSAAMCGVELPPLPSFTAPPLFERVLRARGSYGPRKSVTPRREHWTTELARASGDD